MRAGVACGGVVWAVLQGEFPMGAEGRARGAGPWPGRAERLPRDRLMAQSSPAGTGMAGVRCPECIGYAGLADG